MRNLIIILFFLFNYTMFGQGYIDLAEFKIGSTTPNNFKDSSQSTRVENIGLNITIPVPIKDKTVLLMGLNIDRSKLKLDISNASSSLYLTGAEFGIHKQVSTNKGITFMLRPQITSDTKSLSNKKIKWGVLALLTHNKGANKSFKYGIYYKDEFYGPLIVPLFGFYYMNPDKTWEFDIMAPIKMMIYHHLSSKAALGIKFDGIGTTYRLNDGIDNIKGSYVDKVSNELSGIIQVKISNSLIFKAEMGHSFFRSYKVYNQNEKIDLSIASINFGDKREKINTIFNDGFLFNTTIAYRFHFD